MIVKSVALFIPILVIAAGAGFSVLRLIRFQPTSRIEGFSYSVGFGFLLYALGSFLLGILGWLNQTAVLILLGLLFILGLTNLTYIRTLLFSHNQNNPKPERLKLFIVVGFLFFASLIVFNLIGALSPDTVWDANSYHLYLAKKWVNEQKFVYLPDKSYSAYPLNTSAIYAMEMTLVDGSTMPQLTHFTYGILCALIIYSFVKSQYGSVPAVFSLVVFYSIPALSWLSTTSIADLALTYYSLGAIIAVLKSFQHDEKSWVWMTGLSLGAAMGIKFSALVGFGLISIHTMLRGLLVKKNLRWGASHIIMIGVVAVLISLPWYVRSYIHTSNPIYPFGYSIFGGNFWSDRLAEKLMAGVGINVRSETFLISELKLLFRLLKPEHMPYGGPISWIFIAILIWGAFHWRKKPVSFLLFYFVGFYLFWARFTWQQVRYMLPALGALSIVFGYAVRSIVDYFGHRLKFDLLDKDNHQKFSISFRISVVILGLLMTGIMVEGVWEYWKTRSYSFKDQISVVLNRTSRDVYLLKYFYMSSMFFYINEEIPIDATILSFNEVRGFLSDREFIWGVPELQGYIDYDKLTQNGALRERFEQIGVDYILINNTQYTSEAKELEPIREDMKLVKQIGEIYLYGFDPLDE